MKQALKKSSFFDGKSMIIFLKRFHPTFEELIKIRIKRIVLFLATMILIFGPLSAQSRRISGKVTSQDDGASLPGVSVTVKGTTLGTITDADGIYSLQVPEDAEALLFSFVGMQSQESPIGEKAVIDVIMQTEVLDLQEVVVTAVGISRTQKALGYAVSSVSSDETLMKSEPDLLKSLQGKVPGVDIRQASGVPGSASRITVRGVTSFYGDNEPLFVVDGIPYSNVQYNTTDQNSGGGAYGSGISTLDPNDIKSINVLKGAAAAALYGSRAKNGVIVITTKSGDINPSRKGLEVSVSSSVNWEEISNLPDYQNTYGNGVDFVYQNANGSWGSRFDSQDSIEVWPQYKAAFPDMFSDSVPYVPQPNNVKDLFKTGMVYENSVNISGGNESSSYNLTASNLQNDGYIPFSEFDRNSISLGGGTQLDNGIKATGSFSYSTSKQVGGIFGNNQATDDNAASSFARALWLGRTWDMSLPYEDPATGGPVNWNGNNQYDHPMWSWEHNKVITDMDRIVGNFGLSYNIFEWLNASYQVGVNTFVQRRQQIIDKYSRAYGGDGAIIDDDVWRQEIESNFLLSINRQLGTDFDIKAILGHNLNQRVQDRQLFRGRLIINDGIYDLDNTNNVVPFGGQYWKHRLWGVFADVSLSYKSYLFLNVTSRNDWSSTLPKDKNSYFYPAFSGSFIFSEAFGLTSDMLSLGKLRVSWGKVGMDALPYSLQDVYINKNNETNIGVTKLSSFPFLGQPGSTTPNQGNDPELNPEFKTEFEVGAEIGMFNHRINMDLTYYNSTSTDMIFPVAVANSSGYGQLYTNIGELNNKGVELGLNLVPVRTVSGFSWDIYTAYTKNISEVMDIFDTEPEEGEVERTTLYGVFGDPSIIVQVGQPYGVFYGNVAARDDDGNLLIDPASGQMIIALEQEIYGDPNPDFKIGVTNTFRFKGLKLRALFDYTHGGDVYSYSIGSLLGRGVTKDTEDREHNFVIPGVIGDPNTREPVLDEDGNTIPNVTKVSMNDLYFSSGATSSFAMNSAGEWLTFDATVFRLREVALGFELPKQLLGKTPFGSAEISVSGRNLWFFTPNLPEYVNFDPEVNAYGNQNIQGVEYTIAPSVRRYGVNLKFTF